MGKMEVVRKEVKKPPIKFAELGAGLSISNKSTSNESIRITPLYDNEPPVVGIRITESRYLSGYTAEANFTKEELKEIIDILTEIYEEMEE
jgi:hypothetical protein